MANKIYFPARDLRTGDRVVLGTGNYTRFYTVWNVDTRRNSEGKSRTVLTVENSDGRTSKKILDATKSVHVLEVA